MKARTLGFAELTDAEDYLISNGFYRFTDRTFQHRHNGKTAHITTGTSGASVTIL